ncbi:MAG: hypothetical protein HQK89_02485 [Nitrospirae bacterium]|nr:hypothetical protein [Nitrospirota bacterium]
MKNVILDLIQTLFSDVGKLGWLKTSGIALTVLLAAYQLFGRLILKLWKTLESDIINWASSAILSFVRGISFSFTKRYHDRLIYDYKAFNVKGLGLISSYTRRICRPAD